MDDLSLISPFDAFISFGVYFLCLDVIEVFPGSYRSVCLDVIEVFPGSYRSVCLDVIEVLPGSYRSVCLDVIEVFPGSYRSVCLGVHGKSLLYVVVDMPLGILDIF
jgi:hypothetical protein